MKSEKNAFLAIFYIVISGFSSLWAQDSITVYPREYSDALSNPFKGFRPEPNKANDYPYPTIVREYIKWNEVENHWSDGADKIIEHCNNLWKGFENQNIKVAVQIYIDWDANTGNEYWPQDIVDELGWPTWDIRYWQSDLVKERIEKLIYKMGEAWDNDPRVAWVNTAIVGYWGEQENPVGVDEEGYVKLMGEAFDKAFNNKKLLVRNQKYWDAEGYNWGVGWGSFAHPGQTNGSWTDIRRTTANGQYLTQIIEGEVAYNWGQDVFEPVYGSSPTVTLGTDQYSSYMIDVIRELHCTGLGWVASYKTDGTDGTDPDKVRENASAMQKAFGYRFLLPEFSCSSQTNQGDSLKINFKVQNAGSAPFYYNWETAFVLIDESTHDIVWKETLTGVDCRSWEPGKNYNYLTHEYDIPATVHEIISSVKVPDSIETGQYMAGITILEPFSGTPGVFFAIENFLKKSQTQPLCRIGIGEDLTGSVEVDPSIFADPLYDDARFYTLTPQSKTYSISSNTPNGSLKFLPKGDSYAPGTTVTVQAVGELGYEFSYWGGDLSGIENPVTILMDGNKSISASFDEVPTYKLSVNAANGAVSLSPAGGVYNEGTLVRMSHTADFGYKFGSWTGDASGFEKYIEVIMDSDKEVTANFDFVGAPLETFAVNCGGSSYTASDGTFFNADKNYSGGSVFSTNAFISGTDDQTLYQSERYGNVSYSIDLPNGIYEVSLMFAEIYHEEAGKRIFDVSIEGNSVIKNLDIYAKAGSKAAYNETHIVALEDGKLNISFQKLSDNAKISAIKVKPDFKGNAYNVDIQSVNGSVSLNPQGKTFMEGSKVSVTATPDYGYVFSGWSGDISGNDNPANIVIDSNLIVTANFVRNTNHILFLESINGSITLDPPGGEYSEGTVVTLTANPNAGYYFKEWSGDIAGSESPVTITMNSDKNVSAEFINANALLLAINSVNGSVQVIPKQETYNRGASVVLVATADEGFEFAGWEGDLNSSNNPIGFIMDGDKNITAVFKEITSTGVQFINDSLQNGLIRIFPNPFTTESTIQYRLNRASQVKLTIYNSLGRHIATLADEYQTAGSHSVIWIPEDAEGKRLAGGLYIIRLVTDNNALQIEKACLIN